MGYLDTLKKINDNLEFSKYQINDTEDKATELKKLSKFFLLPGFSLFRKRKEKRLKKIKENFNSIRNIQNNTDTSSNNLYSNNISQRNNTINSNNLNQNIKNNLNINRDQLERSATTANYSNRNNSSTLPTTNEILNNNKDINNTGLSSSRIFQYGEKNSREEQISRNLDEMSIGLRHLKQMALSIDREIDTQNVLLQSIGDKSNETKERLKLINKKLDTI